MKYRQMFLLVLLHKNLQPIHFQGFLGGQIPNIPKSEITLQARPFSISSRAKPPLPTAGNSQPQLSTLPGRKSLRSIGKPRRFSGQLGLLFFEMMHPPKRVVPFLVIPLRMFHNRYILIHNHQKWFRVETSSAVETWWRDFNVESANEFVWPTGIRQSHT